MQRLVQPLNFVVHYINTNNMSWLLIDWGSASDLAIREVSFTKIASIKLDESWCRSWPVGDVVVCFKPWSRKMSFISRLSVLLRHWCSSHPWKHITKYICKVIWDEWQIRASICRTRSIVLDFLIQISIQIDPLSSKNLFYVQSRVCSKYKGQRLHQ